MDKQKDTVRSRARLSTLCDGGFSVLPREIRVEIWIRLLPKDTVRLAVTCKANLVFADDNDVVHYTLYRKLAHRADPYINMERSKPYLRVSSLKDMLRDHLAQLPIMRSLVYISTWRELLHLRISTEDNWSHGRAQPRKQIAISHTGSMWNYQILPQQKVWVTQEGNSDDPGFLFLHKPETGEKWGYKLRHEIMFFDASGDNVSICYLSGHFMVWTFVNAAKEQSGGLQSPAGSNCSIPEDECAHAWFKVTGTTTAPKLDPNRRCHLLRYQGTIKLSSVRNITAIRQQSSFLVVARLQNSYSCIDIWDISALEHKQTLECSDGLTGPLDISSKYVIRAGGQRSSGLNIDIWKMNDSSWFKLQLLSVPEGNSELYNRQWVGIYYDQVQDVLLAVDLEVLLVIRSLDGLVQGKKHVSDCVHYIHLDFKFSSISIAGLCFAYGRAVIVLRHGLSCEHDNMCRRFHLTTLMTIDFRKTFGDGKNSRVAPPIKMLAAVAPPVFQMVMDEECLFYPAFEQFYSKSNVEIIKKSEKLIYRSLRRVCPTGIYWKAVDGKDRCQAWQHPELDDTEGPDPGLLIQIMLLAQDLVNPKYRPNVIIAFNFGQQDSCGYQL